MYAKIDRYILIAILVVVIIAVALIYLTRKENNEHHDAQDDLLLAMAEKLRVSANIPESDVREVKESKSSAPKDKPQLTDDEEEQIIGIADKLCFNQPLTPEEKDLSNKFSKETKERLQQSRQILANIINKFLSGAKTNDFEEYEKEYYEQFQEPIDNMIGLQKSVEALALKISKGETNFADEELQLQSNYPKQLEQALAAIKKKNPSKPPGEPKIDLKGANPPLSEDQKLKIILNIFEDGIPRHVKDLATIYSEKAKVPYHKGNISRIFGKLVHNGNLMTEKIKKQGKEYVYHGPASWFENGKLKPHYKNNIKKS